MVKKIIAWVCTIAVIGLIVWYFVPKTEKVNTTHPYTVPAELSSVESGQIADNENFALYWDADVACVLLENKNTGKIWSSIPYDFYMQEDTEGIGKVRMESPINIEYVDKATSSINISYGSVSVMDEGMIGSKKIKNGIKVVYYFDKLKISVPVVYALTDDGVEATIPVEEIGEGEYPIYSVSLLPFFCSVKNNPKSWLFMPSGSGTLMYTDENQRTARECSLRVYGEEAAATRTQSLLENGSVPLPVYGASDGNDTMMAVVSHGAELASIDAQVGDSEIGYSSACTTFVLRGSDILQVAQMYSGYKALVRKSTEKMVDVKYASVRYYPLSGEDAGYDGMARKYRSVLFDGQETTEKTYSPLYLEFYGGAQVTENILGVTHNELKVATTYKQAQKMLKEISSATGTNPTVTLTGFGTAGLDIEKIGGGFDFAGAFGSESERETLQKYCADSGINLSVDYDILRFSKSGLGVSAATDGVKTANGTVAKQYYYLQSNYSANQKSYYLLVNQENMTGVIKKLFNTLNQSSLQNVSLTTFGSLAYSDYSNTAFYSKNGFPKTVSGTIDQIHGFGKKVFMNSPNDYAAVKADAITGSPIASCKTDGFDQDIPFYQIVMHGSVPIAGAAINLAEEPQTAFLKAIESGSSLSFALSYQWQDGFENTPHDELKYSDYNAWKETVKEYTDAAKEYLDSVRDATISEHHILTGNVTQTVFSNGVCVYVNYGSSAAVTPIGTVEAGSYAVGSVQ